jgi:hypothetical protein
MRLRLSYRKETDPDPDPLVRDTDPQIRIRIKMSRISNNACGDAYGARTLRDLLLHVSI